MAWTPFRRVRSSSFASGGKDAATEGGDVSAGQVVSLVTNTASGLKTPSRDGSPRSGRHSDALDAIGQRDEQLRQRLDMMADRLIDLRSLQDDFNLILDPLIDISGELAKASVRTAELESVLSQETRSNSALREEVADLSKKLSSVSSEFEDVRLQYKRISEDLRERDATVEVQKIELRDKVLALENVERQLSSEVEQNKALVAENRALRHEAQTTDSALARSEHELSGARERIGLLEVETRRLDLLSEDQAIRLANYEARYGELETAAEADRQRLRVIESQLAVETAARERSEAQHEADAVAFRTERSSLTLKLEAATNRIASTDQIIVQVRNQLREKDEEFRAADRTLKEAIIARNVSERRIEALQDDLARQTERFIEIQRMCGELNNRCDMLGKAIAAKDTTIEQLNNRNAALNDRIEQLVHRQETARADLEAANRRLGEELNNERSERSLLQGALDIARESRINLQKQHDAFKRSGRPWRELVAEEDPGADEGHGAENSSNNVRSIVQPSH